MIDCKYLERRDTSMFGSDVFDHPNYDFFCNRSGEPVEIFSPNCVKSCKYYVPEIIKTKSTAISVSFPGFTPSFKMIIEVPVDRDAEEYIDDLLEEFVSEDMFYNLVWDFE